MELKLIPPSQLDMNNDFNAILVAAKLFDYSLFKHRLDEFKKNFGERCLPFEMRTLEEALFEVCKDKTTQIQMIQDIVCVMPSSAAAYGKEWCSKNGFAPPALGRGDEVWNALHNIVMPRGGN